MGAAGLNNTAVCGRMGAAGLQLHLSTLLALLSALPARVSACPALLEQTWRHLTPSLVRLLGSPTAAAESEPGRGSGLPPADARLVFR